MLETREETRAGEDRRRGQRENREQIERVRRCENRQRPAGLAMTGSKQRYYAKMGRGRVVVEMFMQRGRDTEEAGREQREGYQRGEKKST